MELEDESDAARTWEPWAYPPRCVVRHLREAAGGGGGRDGDKRKGQDKRDYRAGQDGQDGQDGQEDGTANLEDKAGRAQDGGKGKKTRYCLYTNTFFGEGGISLLARPEAAADAATLLLDAYHSSFPSPETVQHYHDYYDSGSAASSSSSFSSAAPAPAYRVVDMPDKGGKGVEAARPIRRRETFLVDHASVVGDLGMWGSVSQSEGRDLLELAAEQLVNPGSVRSLSRGGGGGAQGVEGVIRANTFRTFLDGVPQKALFPKISVEFPPLPPFCL